MIDDAQARAALEAASSDRKIEIAMGLLAHLKAAQVRNDELVLNVGKAEFEIEQAEKRRHNAVCALERWKRKCRKFEAALKDPEQE